ncbi:signal transduction histidine kinase [Kitasatospora sp. MAA4]|uniref:sensor histidine kinase n=1 Tax=Kitasatospora sp. MAA4 TaxID=3035093 RepID=UPI002473D482|nr:histidine kinase [Kitasatospora sp. MAA4]MDH6133474.1 signal transduction histidine kinase [Kitasatospora sp. MAA4]
MSGTTMTRRGPLAWIGGRLRTAARAPVFCVPALMGAGVLLAPMLLPPAVWFFSLTPSVGTDRVHNWLWLELLLLPLTLLGTRWLAQLTRGLAGRWCGVPITAPYRPAPDGDGSRLQRWAAWVLTDPATWRDLLWTAANATWLVVLSALLAPPVLFVLGVFTKRLPAPGLSAPVTTPDVLANTFYAFASRPMALASLAEAVAVPIAVAALGLLAGPRLLTGYASVADRLLGPTQQAELTLRVRHLAETRSDTLDTGAAELRRIERDLHDGAQARLVAMGMTISAADQLVDVNPAAARALLAEAMTASVKALAELRDLVRGIHPPVLADRGLTDAVQALALDLPLRVHCAGELTGRPPAPVESAAYFAVNELLANVAKHAGADQAWIDISHTGGTLRIGVADDGRGGADPENGTGLSGLERRLAAFDGVLAVSSPPGGPTLVNLEIPCALSSPKTSSS